MGRATGTAHTAYTVTETDGRFAALMGVRRGSRQHPDCLPTVPVLDEEALPHLPTPDSDFPLATNIELLRHYGGKRGRAADNLTSTTAHHLVGTHWERERDLAVDTLRAVAAHPDSLDLTALRTVMPEPATYTDAERWVRKAVRANDDPAAAARAADETVRDIVRRYLAYAEGSTLYFLDGSERTAQLRALLGERLLDKLDRRLCVLPVEPQQMIAQQLLGWETLKRLCILRAAGVDDASLRRDLAAQLRNGADQLIKR